MTKSTYAYIGIIALGLLFVIYFQYAKIGELKLENHEFDLKVEQLEKRRIEAVNQSMKYVLLLDSLTSVNDSLKKVYINIPTDEETTPNIIIHSNDSWSDITGVLKVDVDSVH